MLHQSHLAQFVLQMVRSTIDVCYGNPHSTSCRRYEGTKILERTIGFPS
jgi:hypothetical protein